MALEDADACVYVKESVLRELEQERRRLKWQLSRALQTSDVRAAELEASKAKVKDLLTIVEVNKGVADQVVQRSQGREAQRRAELETLHQQSKQQRQRYVDLALRSMNRRVRDRQQRDAFHSLQQAVLLRSRRREAILRLLARDRWRSMRRSLERWKRSCRLHEYGAAASRSAKVHPISSDQLGIMEGALTREQLVPSAEHTNTKLSSSDSRQFVRWQLLRKVWRNWEHVVRWKRRHRAFVRTASKRSQRLVFSTWKSRTRALQQRRELLRRVLARTNRRIQQLGLTSFRLRCAEVSAHEWSEVLKTAHIAMEEERKLRAEVQSSAASELHTAYIREHQRQQRFTELQTQRLEHFKRRECKHRALMMLRCEVIRTRQKNAIALRFQRLQRHRRILRRLFTSWRREAARSRRIKSAIAASDARRDHTTRANCFRLFAWALQRRRQRRFRLRALLSKLRRAWLLRGWVCLRIRSAIEQRNAIAHVEMWQFSQQAEVIRAACEEKIRRSRRVALKYQITCALLMSDKKHKNLLRRVFCRWSNCTAINARRSRALRSLAARKRDKELQTALHLWGHFNDGLAVRFNQLNRYHLTRRVRALQTAFESWKRNTHGRLRLRLEKYQQRSFFRAWRQSHHLRQQHVQWFGRFLQRSIAKWQRQAFQSWKQKHDRCVKACVWRKHAEHELVTRLWRRWIGFVTFRVHKRHLQQKKALSGLKHGMQRAILSTVFTSWQASWRRSQSRNKLIVRAFRINTSHARERKYLQVWHRHSSLTVQRRRALSRIFQHRNLRNLHNKWQQWIRLSLRDTIATLKNSTLQAQEHVENVLRSTTRTDVLRRMIRRWRSTAAESKRQQHRRALFAEKRRYMTLQATMRQWQWKVACSPLTKQHRLMQHLLNKLRQSVERHAFRLWERQAHKKTLFERDRIGAELFRRSEIRVMALAEEIRVERERRVVFTSWKIITTRKKYACECLQRILLRKQQWLIQNSWSMWVMRTQTQHCLERLLAMITQRRKAAAWCKLMQIYHYHDLRSTGARRAGIIWRKMVLRHAWHHWKRIDSLVATHTALTEAQSSSIDSMLAFKETLARRHHRKRCQTSVFVAWKQHLVCTKRIRLHLLTVLEKRVEATTAWHFQKWRTIVERQNHLQQLLHQVVRRHQTRELRIVLDRWRRWTLIAAHQQYLDQIKLAFSRQREVSAQHIAAVKFLSWQRPCLEAHFVRWKVFVEQRRRYVVEQIIAHTQRYTLRLLRRAWWSWQESILQTKRRAYLLTRTLNRTQLGFLSFGFYRWGQWDSWMQDLDERLIRLIRMYEIWRWRRGFSALRQHYHEIVRRQSVMAASAYSAHSIQQRERHAKMMRGIVLVLQRKTSTSLCDRSFRQWLRYVKAKAKTKSMIRLAQTRSQKRTARRCLIRWQQCTRHSALLQQKVRRRQEVWEYRRQRKFWFVWVFFTQHSVDVKRSIYDKLVICALRHSLQGAWVRWKSYTKHANDFLGAQRDKQMTALEDKHEELLLRAAQLGQQNNTLRQLLVSSAARKINHMLDFRRKSCIAVALEIWKHKLRQIRVLRLRIIALTTRYQRLVFYQWQYSTSQHRRAEEMRRIQLDATEWAARVVHTCATQWLKRRVFLSWKTFTRTCREIKRNIAASKRRRNHKLIQICWVNWRTISETRARQQDAITALTARKRLKTLVQAHWQWRGVCERSGLAKQNALRMCILLRRAWHRRLLIHGWNRWKAFMLETDAATLQSHLGLVELEHQNTVQRFSRLQSLFCSFSNWRLYVRSRRGRLEGCTRAVAAAGHRRILHRHFEYWKRRVAMATARQVLLRRMGRHLRRHYKTLAKFALWVWFSRVRAESRALRRMTTQLQVASKQFTSTTDVAARIARALFTDLLVAEHQLLRSQQRSAWKVVNSTVRNARRRHLRVAFDRLASGPTATRTKRRFLAPTHVANARAFVDKMTSVLLRWGYQRWKRQYVALAIQEAEEAQQELLRALHHVTSYRQALDPYTKRS